MSEQHESREIANLNPRLNLAFSSSAAAIVPHDMNEAYRLAQAIHLSGLQPKDLNTPEKVMVAILHGLEIGLKPMQAVQRIAVINGRPTIWGDAAIGLVRSSGLLEWIKERIDGTGDDRTAVCEAKRRGDPEPISKSFSVGDAKKAGLWGKAGPWTQYQERMLQMRARGFCLRDAFADVLGGMYLREEIEGEAIDVTPAIPTPPAPPPPAPVQIPMDALTDFDAFHKALDSAPSMTALNAMYTALTNTMSEPDDLAEAKERYNEVAAKFPEFAGAM